MNDRADASPAIRFRPMTLILLAGLAVAGILVHGYHYGFDDQCVYLPAIKRALDPSLFPYDSVFFLDQTRLGCFVSVVAWSVRITRCPLPWALLLWHFGSVLLLLAGCWRIARHTFRTAAGVYGGLLLLTVVLTLPVAGTFVVICDPYLHTRVLSTALLLFAFAELLERRLSAAVWLVLAGLIHPLIALLGCWHLAVQAWPWSSRKFPAHAPAPAAALVVLPLGALGHWIADPADPAWRSALAGDRYLFPGQWTWYELVGAFAPLAILYAYSRLAGRRGLPELSRICRRLAVSGSVGVAAGLAIGLTPSLLPLVPFEPMRTLHFIYLCLAVFTGGLAGELLPRTGKSIAAALLVPLAVVMYLGQRADLGTNPHIEWPGAAPRNDWRRAFAWIRENTPRDALFAMNPDLLRLPGENEHGFRALAERSRLADSEKDRAVSRNLPALAWEWREEVRAQRGMEGFDLNQLADLRARFGVSWLVLRKEAGRAALLPGLDCPYENSTLRVCRAPGGAAARDPS
ncbi:MAG TPA: DUF6798 domain-containing protein [Candidatus Acidoferrales bacterium]|nr:DUF6798 domain-containing protein [Candidatus Acidoferrales bacterium]